MQTHGFPRTRDTLRVRLVILYLWSRARTETQSTDKIINKKECSGKCKKSYDCKSLFLCRYPDLSLDKSVDVYPGKIQDTNKETGGRYFIS